jgi:hypothetical protein
VQVDRNTRQHTVLGCDVQRDGESWSLSRNTRDVNDSLRVDKTRFALGRSCSRVQPAGDRQLCRSDGVNQVDVQTGVMADSVGAVRVVLGLCGSWWVPEIGPVGFEDASARAYLLELILVR